ncbi:MAG: hypothetical protein WBA17_18455 [Saprospiraceae bacterium]
MPFGMKMTGPWMGASNTDHTAYQYNGIEHVADFDLDVNMALYRTLDPLTGRWWQVDPKAEKFMGLSPYNSMLNSPMVNADPLGDEPITLVAIAIGMAIGAGTHTASHLIQNNGTFQNWNWGAFAGSIVAGGVGAGVSGALTNAGIGGFAGGFGAGAASGFTQSTVSGLINGNLNGGTVAQSTLLGRLIGGTVSGVGAAIGGRNFWDGSTRTTLQVLGSNPVENVGQEGANNCLCAVADAIDPNITQDQARNWFPGTSPEDDPLDIVTFWDKYAAETGRIHAGSFSQLPNPRQFAGMMNNSQIILYSEPSTSGVLHAQVLKSVNLQQVTRVNGAMFTRLRTTVFNPASGGSFTTMSNRTFFKTFTSFYRINR